MKIDQFVSLTRSGREIKGRVTDVDANGALSVRVYDKRDGGGYEPTRRTITVEEADARAIDPLPTKGVRGAGSTTEHRTVQVKVLETRAADDTESGLAQAWVRVNDYTMTDTYGTRFAPGGAKEYLDANPNRPTLLFGHGMSGGIHSVLGHRLDWREDATGLDVLFEFDDFDAVPTARQAFAQLQSGSLDSFSVGFIRQADEYIENSDGSEYVLITKYALPENSIVVEASNPGTKILALSGARSTQADLVSHVIIRMAEGDLDLADALTEVRDALAHPEGDTGDQTWAGIAEIASNVDAAVDAIRAEVENPTAPDNKQTMALVSLAEAMCDELLEALGVDDPDDDDTDTGADDATQGAMMESSGRSKSPKAVTCPTCQGRGTILKGARACPMCKGDKKVLPITAAKHFMKGSSRSGDDTETDEEREARETAEWNAAVVDHERTLALADADDILMLIDG